MTPLVQWIWQGTALALAFTALLRCLPRVHAGTRYALWWLALVLVLALPRLDAVLAAWMSPGPFTAAVTDGAHGAAPGGVTQATALFTVPALPDWTMALLAGLWLGTVVLGVGRIVAGLRAMARLKAGSQLLSPSTLRDLPLARAGRRDSRDAEIRVSRSLAGACAIGLRGRPAIVVSSRLLRTLTPEALDLIVLHEQVHLARYDDWARLLQAVVQAFAGLHPGVRLITWHLDREREAACDSIVAARSGDARRYAASLADAADAIAGRSPLFAPLMVPNAAGTGSLVARVERLLDPRVEHRTTVQRRALGALALLLVSTAGLVVAAGPTVLAAGPGGVPGTAPVAPVARVMDAPGAGEPAVMRPEAAADAAGGREPLAAAPPAQLARAPKTTARRPTAIAQATSPAVTAAPAPPPAIVQASGRVEEAHQVDRPDVEALPSRPVASLLLPAVAAAPETGDVTGIGGRFAELGTRAGSSTGAAGRAIGRAFSRAGRAVASRMP